MSNPILGPAIRQGTVCICLPEPNRHHHCIRYAVTVLGLKHPIGAPALSQGFYDARGIFLDRETAFIIAKENGQITNPEANKILYTEDMW